MINFHFFIRIGFFLRKENMALLLQNNKVLMVSIRLFVQNWHFLYKVRTKT